MALRGDANDWGAVAKLLHWSMAAGVLGMIGLGVTMTRLDSSDAGLKFRLFQQHKSFGFVLLCLAVARVAWRVSARSAPAHPSGRPVTERRLARIVHGLLYVCLVAMPVTGLLAASASPLGIPTVVFGALELPRLVAPDAELSSLLDAIHTALAWSLAALVSFHAAGALWHALILRDGVMGRMLPRGTARSGSGRPGAGEWTVS